ncbi:Acyltransferase family protein [compost metagenome]
MIFSEKEKLLTIEQSYNKRNNSFDVIRFILSLLVIYSHSFVLLGVQGNGGDIIERLTHNQLSGGSLAVKCFFVVSGFLIMQSLAASPSITQYFKNRTLRIFPAFFVSLSIMAFIVGPLITNLEWRDYFSYQDGSPYSFVLKNILMNINGYAWTVRDLFSNVPFPGSINGSMWTLKHEIAMYLVLPIFGFFLLIRFRNLFLLATCSIIILSYLNIMKNYNPLNLNGNIYWVLSNNEYSSFIQLAPYFLVGSLLYLYKERIVLNSKFFAITLFIAFISLKAGVINYTLILVLPYALIFVAVKFRYSKFRKYGDFSYGLYIYAFPIQQLIVYFWRDSLNITTFILLNCISTFIVSFLSWHLIEKKALKLKVGGIRLKNEQVEV